MRRSNDVIVTARLGPREDSPVIAGSGFGRVTLPQNLRNGQRWRSTAPSRDAVDSYSSVGKIIVKVGGDPGGL